MASQSAINNLYKIYLAATAELRAMGQDGAADRLFEDFGHELMAWDVWYDEGARADERPDYTPTLAALNGELKRYGLRGVGGRNARVVKLDPPKSYCTTCGEELGSKWATGDCKS